MARNRHPEKQIIQNKLQKWCDDNKSIGGVLRYEDVKTENDSIKNPSKKSCMKKKTMRILSIPSLLQGGNACERM